jgi:hypothetical protein
MRVLACTSREAEARLRALLPDAELRFAFTFAEGLKALSAADYDLLIIGMMFDESRALEFLREVHSADLPPLVGIHGAKLPQKVAPATFELPMRALGALDVIDFGSIPKDEAGNADIRARLLKCAGRRRI